MKFGIIVEVEIKGLSSLDDSPVELYYTRTIHEDECASDSFSIPRVTALVVEESCKNAIQFGIDIEFVEVHYNPVCHR